MLLLRKIEKGQIVDHAFYSIKLFMIHLWFQLLQILLQIIEFLV